MNQIKTILRDVLYVSKVTRVNNKKLLIVSVTLLAQLTAITDIAIISLFAALIAGQITNIEFVNSIIDFILGFPIIIFFMVLFRFVFLYYQQILIKDLEFRVSRNMKTYMLNEIFEKRNYSVADSYFYINTLSGHIAYFYSSFSGFITSLLQILIYMSYLLIVDVSSVGIFLIGIAILVVPIKKLLETARSYMDKTYYKGQDANREIQRVVENMFLIKILKKDKYEMNRFDETLKSLFGNQMMNYKAGVLNAFLPSFLTLISLSLILGFSSYAKTITLDFIGVTLRLFQSLGNLTGSMNQIINSHVHIEKFYELDNNRVELKKENFQNLDYAEVSSISLKHMQDLYLLLKNYSINLSVAVYPWPGTLRFDKPENAQVKLWRDFCNNKCLNFYNFMPKFFSEIKGKDFYESYKKIYIEGDIHFNSYGNEIIADEFILNYKN